MIGLVLNVIVGLALVLWGFLILNESPVTSSFMNKIQKAINNLKGGEYHVPFYIIGLIFTLIGLSALFVAFMIFAQEHGFWII